jgi:hypothetical protein
MSRVRTVIQYRFRKKERGKWATTRYTLTEEEAARRFAGQEYERIDSSREERRVYEPGEKMPGGTGT